MKPSHRIALISDIHGNAFALRQVLRSIEQRGTDEIVCLGDVATLGAAPGEVVDTLRRIGCRCIKGNHDDYVLDANLADGHNDSSLIRQAIDWCRDQLSREQIAFISRFEDAIDIPLGSHDVLKVFHGSPSSNMTDLLADTPADVFDVDLGPERSVVMAGGHTHLQMLRQHRGVLVVNPGSVGAPFREHAAGGPPVILPHAEFASIESRGDEISVVLHRVPLDRHALIEAALSSSNPMAESLAAQYR